MEGHWESASDWESLFGEDDNQDRTPKEDLSPGSYHCKSALRTHESNMKLYMYKNSFLTLQGVITAPGYTQEVLLLLPDLWRCFYDKTHGLDRVLSVHTSSAHATPSLAFGRWADYTLKDINTGNIIKDLMMAEQDMWGHEFVWLNHLDKAFFMPVQRLLSRVFYLIYFLNLSLLVMNHRENQRRPDITVLLPGIVVKLDDDIYEVKYNDYLRVITHKDATVVITPIFCQTLQKDIYLTLCDKINERANVMIGAHFITTLSGCTANDTVPHDKGIYQATQEIIQWGDRLLYAKMNRAFDIIAKYEAYCVSSILLHDDERIWNNKEFQDNLRVDDATNLPDMLWHVSQLLLILNSKSPSVLSELHGLWRIWGHPITDVEGGMKKMEDTCMKQKSIDNFETLIGLRTFKYTFSVNYKKKHGHYPLSNMTEKGLFDKYSHFLQERDIITYQANIGVYNPESYVQRCLREDMKMNNRDSRYRHADWDHVVFLQNFQIPQSLNLATMIKDKAISQTRSELVESVSTRRSVFDPKRRRGVLKWLSEQTFRLRDFLGNIDLKGLSINDMIIGLYPKERELKIKARFFSLMSYNMRMFITATEEIMGKFILPYFPMITMSDTLLSMMIRLYNMTTNIGARRSHVVYSMNIDFSKWNQNMREKTNDGIFSSIDHVLGFRRLISRTHEIFRGSYLYLCSGEYIPSIIRGCLTTMSPYSRIGDESGKEGLRQKGWTITTVCDILSLALKHNVEIELIGGGDNQVLTIKIRSDGRAQDLSNEKQMHKIKQRMLMFRNELSKKMSKRGLPLKLEETWISHRLLMYNKIMYYDGVPLPGRLKVISRMFSNSNEGICTLGSITSTLGTGYQALSAKDYDPVLAWIMSRYMTLINLGQYYLFNPVCGTRRLDKQIDLSRNRLKDGLEVFGHDEVSMRAVRNKEQLNHSTHHKLTFTELFLICIYYHKVLGGPGIGSPLAYMMKGFPDPLAEALTSNYITIKNLRNPVIRSKIVNLTSVVKNKVMHWEHLLEDPVSVNHDAPPHGIAALRTQAEEILKTTEILNVRFKELISLGDNEFLRSLSEKLCSTRDVEPRLLHDIVGSTIPGYVNTILSKVDQSATLNKLSSSTDVIFKVYAQEIQYYMFLSDKIHITRGHAMSACPTYDARVLRNSTWERNIVGVTTPHPCAFLRATTHSSHDVTCDQSYISTLVKKSPNDKEPKRGPFHPYFGSYTTEKFKSGILASAYGDEDILKRSLKIQKLLGWRFLPGSKLYHFIQCILGCVTDADPNKFLPLSEEITGDVEHRYHDMATKHGGIPTNLIRFYTNVSCNTTTFTAHSKGAANEAIHFQAAIIYCCMSSILKTHEERHCTKLLHFHETCKQCIVPTYTPEDQDDQLPELMMVTCPGNDLMYIKEKDIPVHFHSHIAYSRMQEKLAKLEERGGNKAPIPEGKERASWLILIVATILTSDTIKLSTMKLIIDDMSLQETLFVLKSILCVHMIKKKLPTASYDMCDIEDVYKVHSRPIDEILKSSKILDQRIELGYPIRSGDVTASTLISEVISWYNDDLDQEVKTGLGKYQDPEYKDTKILLCTLMNPSSKTCKTCANIIYNISVNYDIIGCSVHGLLNIPNLFHLYSLDKLSKFKGDSPITLPGSESMKRKPQSLFASIKQHKDNSGKRIKKIRDQGFLRSKIKMTADMQRTMSCEWNDLVVTDNINVLHDELQDEYELISEFSFDDRMPPMVGDIFGISQSMIHIIHECDAKRRITGTQWKKSEHVLTIGFELLPRKDNIEIVKKIIEILDTVSLARFDVAIIMMFFVADVANLEDSSTEWISYLITEYNVTLRDNNILLKNVGDSCYDVNLISSRCDIMVLRSILSFQYMNGDTVYIISREDEMYGNLNKIDKECGALAQHYKVRLQSPKFSVSTPGFFVIKLVRTSQICRISEKLVISFLMNLRPVTHRQVIRNLVSDLYVEPHMSIYASIFRSMFVNPVGITSESLFVSTIQKLSAEMHSFTLKSSPYEQLPWRCMAIIRMIIALYILTDTDREGALRYYAEVSGISYRMGTYKEIMLHKRRIPNKKLGLINWTPETLGDHVMRATKDISTWLHISWTKEHIKLTSLVI